MDSCDLCGKTRTLFHDDRDGLAKCDACLDLPVETDANVADPALVIEPEALPVLRAPGEPLATDTPEPVVLLERDYAGLHVSVSYIVDGPSFKLQARTANHSETVEVPGERVMDAFAHPSIYLDTPEYLFV